MNPKWSPIEPGTELWLKFDHQIIDVRVFDGLVYVYLENGDIWEVDEDGDRQKIFEETLH